ncbi:MAG: hypothetical protein ACI9BH_002912 [Paracoccaceae bacterium]
MPRFSLRRSSDSPLESDVFSWPVVILKNPSYFAATQNNVVGYGRQSDE